PFTVNTFDHCQKTTLLAIGFFISDDDIELALREGSLIYGQEGAYVFGEDNVVFSMTKLIPRSVITQV
ncbi:MAG: hypothetical protein ABJZ70_02465, partial [Cyclobacteriaceae bacterium]